MDGPTCRLPVRCSDTGDAAKLEDQPDLAFGFLSVPPMDGLLRSDSYAQGHSDRPPNSCIETGKGERDDEGVDKD